ncbi:site-specific integrase [Desulfovibrio caledoniensis]
MGHLTDEELQRLLIGSMRERLDIEEKTRISTHRHDYPPEYHDEIIGKLQKSLARGEYTISEGSTDEFIEWAGLDVEPESFDYNKLLREVLKRDIELWRIYQQRDQGNYQYEKDYFRDFTTPQVPVPSTGPTGPLLSEALAAFLEGNNQWKATSYKEYKTVAELLPAILGDMPVSQVDHEAMRTYVAKLRTLPKRNKKPYNKMSWDQRLACDVPSQDLVTDGTIQNYMVNTGTFFNWCEDQGYEVVPNVTRRKFKLTKTKRAATEPFTPDDLHTIFHCRQYVNDSWPKPYQFWMPILGLATGARIEELAQLNLDDVKFHEGVWYIMITDEGEGQDAKTESSIRPIPLWPFVTEELNFPEYVERLRRKGETRLFPDLSPVTIKNPNGDDQLKYGKKASDWFSARKNEWGLKPENSKRRKVFHSFRATLASICKHMGIEDRMAEQFHGHSSGKFSMTYDYYAERFHAKELYEAIASKLEFPVDLGHLKKSKYCK